jgi:hypothetical protein
MGIYSLAFLPLLNSTGLSIADLYSEHDIELRLKETKFMGFLHNVFFSTATITFILPLIWRLLVIKVSKIIVTILTGLTVFIWSVTCLLNHIVLPYFTGSSGILYGSIWSAYVLLVDTAVSIAFLRAIYKNDAFYSVEQTAGQRKMVRILVSILIMTTVLNWAILIFPILSATAFSDIPDKRRMAYRFGFCFSSMVNTGSMVFILYIKAIFANGDDSESSAISLKEIAMA